VILCTPDGRSDGELVERARAAWSARAALATFDLPLCGARHSDKLSASALDPSHPLAARLRVDLEAQTAADLERVIALLRSDRDLDPERVSLVGVGLGARFARAFAAGSQRLGAIVLAPEETSVSDDWLRSVGERIAPS
jgi:pimeloyl-ACP methyl ester carboxylesterase